MPIRIGSPITRPYYRSTYVFVAANPAWKSLADMPATRAIGATIGTAADMRLIQYLLAIPAAKRWDKYPMASDEAALQAVINRTTGAALVWAPALWALRNTDPAIAALPEMAPAPLPVSTADVGAILLQQTGVPAQQHRSGHRLADRRWHHCRDPAGRALSPEPPMTIMANAAMTPGPAIQVGAISKRYGRTQALTDISFDVARGSSSPCSVPTAPARPRCCTSSAPSCGLTAGSVRIGGTDVVAHPDTRRRDIGVVFQEPSLDDRLTVHENLNFHGLVYGVPRQAAAAADRGAARRSSN